MNVKRVLVRSLFYLRVGYRQYLSFIISFLGWVSAIYYLAIQNIPFLAYWFPRFHMFLVFALLIFPPVAIVVGWWHLKRSPFFAAERDIVVEASPYTTRKIPPVNVPMWKVLYEIAKKHGVDTREIEKIISESKSRGG